MFACTLLEKQMVVICPNLVSKVCYQSDYLGNQLFLFLVTGQVLVTQELYLTLYRTCRGAIEPLCSLLAKFYVK